LHKIIGLAAPARSGKDTVAALLLKHPQVAAYALADPLKIGCQALFGLTDAETWDDALKEKSIVLWGRSPRQFFQRVGTDWLRQHNPQHWLMRAEHAITPNIDNTKSDHAEPRLLNRQAPFRLAAQAIFGLSDQQTWNQLQTDSIDAYWQMSPLQMFDLLESLACRDFPDYGQRRLQRPVMPASRQLLNIGSAQVIVIKDIRFENEAEFLRRHNGCIWHIVRNDAERVNAHSSEQGIAVQNGDVIIDNNGTLQQLAERVEHAWQAHCRQR